MKPWRCPTCEGTGKVDGRGICPECVGFGTLTAYRRMRKWNEPNPICEWLTGAGLEQDK